MNLGYACINVELSNSKPKITTNRSMVKKTFKERGISYASELGLLNVKDLLKIVEWNYNHNINLFRISSDFFPWASEYKLSDLPDFDEISYYLNLIGTYAKNNNIRLTAHPGPFNVLVSPTESVVNNTITDLTIHGEIFDLMGLEQSPYNKINIHCNGVYGDKISAMDRFIKNFQKLPKSVQTRLTIENDDKVSMYSVKDLMYIHNRINIPIVFDMHHHIFNTGGQTEQEALELAISTWPTNITPIIHYSESKSLHENNTSIKATAHSDYIDKLPNVYGHTVAIMVESKQKEKSILKFINKQI